MSPPPDGTMPTEASVRAALDALGVGARGALGLIAQALRNEVVELLSQPGEGPVVVRYNPRREHRPSVPYAPPARDTGELVQSIQAADVGDGTWRVGSPLVKAVGLEFGVSAVNLLPRPWLYPSTIAFAQRWRGSSAEQAFATLIQQSLGGAGGGTSVHVEPSA